MFALKAYCLQLVPLPSWSKNVFTEFWKHGKISTMSNRALYTLLSAIPVRNGNDGQNYNFLTKIR